jgi:hypothetical protein
MEHLDEYTRALFKSLDGGIPRPSSFPTASEVRTEARERSTDLFSNWETLQNVLKRHEETIRKRWMKRNKAQRKTVLLNAWPNMASMHRPDYHAFRLEKHNQLSQGTKFREYYLWPYINLEDLIEGKSLLLFVNSRGRHPPCTFAHADFEAARIGQRSGAISTAFLNLHALFLDGTTVETYGRLEDSSEAFNMMLYSRAFHPGHGLLILEIQQKILSFLVKCCRIILQDLDPGSLTGDQIEVKPEPPAITRDPNEWPTLSAIAAEAPYRVPSHLDFGRIKAVVAAKRSAAEDHIWALREDPGYFADILGDWSEHRQEKLPDTNGRPHPVLKSAGSVFWERVIGNIFVDAYGGLAVWDLIYRQLVVLESLKEKYSDVISPTEDLPPEYLKALLSFRYLLSQSGKGPILNLKTGVPASPPFRSLFVREPQIPGSTRIQVRSKHGIGVDPLMWMFQLIWDDNSLFLLGLPDIMDELERLLRRDLKQKERISGWVANVLSDLGTIARAQHEIDIYYPWAGRFDDEFEGYRDEIQKEFSVSVAALTEVNGSCEKLSFEKLGRPSDQRFLYPSDKRRTKQNTEAMRKSEVNLDLFWQSVDEQYRNINGKTVHQALKHLFAIERQLERTPEWREPIKQPIDKIGTGIPEDLHQPLSQLSLHSEERPSKLIVTAKTKIKTKGVASSTHSSNPTPPLPLEQEKGEFSKPDVQPTMAVSKRAFKVFSTLFHTPSQSDQPGEIPWSDFLNAMASTGFSPQKLYGSVWQFTPTELDVERSIQFHEPHPQSKIPYRIARRFGRRLQRAYGWHGGMFVLNTDT